ncbi:MAG: hypothetical protein ACREDR_12305 [Blastocatellia bacterium]
MQTARSILAARRMTPVAARPAENLRNTPAQPKLIVLTELGDTDITWATRGPAGAPCFWFSQGEAVELKRYLDTHADALLRSVDWRSSPHTIISHDADGTDADYADHRFGLDLNRGLAQLADYPLPFPVYPFFDESAS